MNTLFSLSILVAFSQIACLPSGHEENFVRLTDRTIPGAVSTNSDDPDQNNSPDKTNKQDREEALDKDAAIQIKTARRGTINFFKGKITIKADVKGHDAMALELNMLDAGKKAIAVITTPCKSGETIEVKGTFDAVKTKWFELLLINEANQVIARHLRPAK